MSIILNFDSIDDENIYLKTKELYEKEGIVVLKGLSLNKLSFELFTQLFCDKFYKITSRGILKEDIGDGFTTTIYPSNIYLFGHTEAHYAPSPKLPDMGFLFCKIPSEKFDGETFLIEGTQIFENFSQKLQDRFKNEKIVYEFLWEEERWKAQFNVSNKKDFLDLFQNRDDVKFTFENEFLHMYYKTSGIINLENGKKSFSNGLLAHLPNIEHKNYLKENIYLKNTNQVYWEKGDAFSLDTINEIIDAHDKSKIIHNWEINDVLIFDNLRFIHGRELSYSNKRTLYSRFGYKKLYY